ncbi:MAG: O-antigen ligase family protein [Patescibacteria group bacterium]|nr:O-antigen ligase family protein [Patescibacteria group bacterium]MDD5164549.1 O-antigen ligase family protein [Patescibacteria group bacterium]MDD5534326.1 O-antigen ligase family protein [Patescibacteria group bacterium]
MPEKTKKIDIVIEILWLAIIFFIPVYLDQGLYNVFEVAKNVLFQNLTEILLFVYLVKFILFYRENIKIFRQRIKYFIPAGIFIAILGVSTIFSQVPWFSFWGSWERRMGYLTWLHFFVFGLLLLLNIRKRNQIYRILAAILASSFFVGIYGAMQFKGLDIFKWTYDPFVMGRIFSSIGQPNFLGSWLLLVIPLVIFGLINKKSLIKYFSFFLLILLFLNLLWTKSRGAWLGALVMIVFMGILFFWRRDKKKIIFPAIFLFIIISLLFIAPHFNISKDKLAANPLLTRLMSLTDLKEAGQYRLMHWQASADLIKDKPILGYGLGGQRFNFPKYYQPIFAVYEKPNIYLDYAHNDILDTLLISGFLGLASYLFLIGSVFWFGLRYLFKNPKSEIRNPKQIPNSKFLILCLLSGLFGYLASIQFSFHVMSTLLYFWLFMVLVIILSNNLTDSENNLISKEKPEEFLTPLKSLMILFVLSLIFLCSWQFNFKLYLSSHYFLNAQKAKAMGDWQEMIQENERAIQFNPNNPYFHQEFALSLYQAGFSSSTKKLDWLETGIENIEMIPQKIRPIEAIIWLSWLKSEKANLTKNQNDFQAAEKAFQDSADFTPGTALVYNHWCDLKVYEENWDQAVKMCEKAISLYPDLNHPSLNEEHYRDVVNEMTPVYLNLGFVYRKIGNPQKAIDYYQKSAYPILKGFTPPYPNALKVIYQEIITTYQSMGQIDSAIYWAQHFQVLWPDDPNSNFILNSLQQK